MNLKNAFITAFRALGKNRMRSALTSVGIIIGVSSVIVMMGMGNSARIAVRDRIYTYGANAMRVIVPSNRLLTTADLENFTRDIPQIKYISPIFNKRNSEVKYKDRRISKVYLFGGNNDFMPMQGRHLTSGRLFSQAEEHSMAKVIIIGQTLVDELFDGNSPLGELIVVDSIPLTVIGVMNLAGVGFSGEDYDGWMLIPYSTARVRIWNYPGFSMIYIATNTTGELTDAAESIRSYLRRKHNLLPAEKDDFQIDKSDDKLKIADDISKALTILLAGIASISLFVGGVGIMNIMLVSVTERTREIGIRMAIGAKRKDIMMQFLIESVTLSSLGGLIGIIIGLVVYYFIVLFAEWPFVLSIPSILLSALFAAAVGVFFGYYPSKKAASLKPIDALKYE